jgi:hypothetical protein
MLERIAATFAALAILALGATARAAEVNVQIDSGGLVGVAGLADLLGTLWGPRFPSASEG